MNENPTLARLGYSPQDRVVILHADDLGMCHAANSAFAKMVDFGWVRSGSVMVPCPWFLELAEYANAHPQIDMGVHLTLNSEWSQYRWGPISTHERISGLLNSQGYFPRTVEQLHDQFDPQAALAEMRAQIERALECGIDVTHIDTHMGSMAHRDLLPGYVDLALEYKIPCLTALLSYNKLLEWGLDPDLAGQFQERYDQLLEAGQPFVDHLTFVEDRSSGSALEQFKKVFDALEPGLTHFFIHPTVPGEDIEAITEDAPNRVVDYEMMVSAELRDYVQEQGIHVIGYRSLRELVE